MAVAKTGGFRLLPSYYEVIRDLPDEERLAIYDAILDFGFGNEVADLPPLLNGYFVLMRPSIEKSVRFEEKQRENGKKGGRPEKPKQNPDETHKNPDETQNGFGENLAIAVAVDSAVEGAVDSRTDKPPTRPRFQPPTIEEVRQYVETSGIPLDADYFWDHYESNGWMVGKSKMRSWKSAARNWVRRDKKKNVADESSTLIEDWQRRLDEERGNVSC